MLCSVSHGEINGIQRNKCEERIKSEKLIVYFPVVTFYLLTVNALHIFVVDKLTRTVVYVSIDNSERYDINIE